MILSTQNRFTPSLSRGLPCCPADERFQIVFETLDQLLTVDVKEKKKIGFVVKEKVGEYGKKK
ncbi:MAG: hypothetical protein KJ550_01995 [Proteobacteria bacterium]|nr:hypothetical protein [Pseudomonadota bacterium]MBU4068984.1 hypothetical protein [Pseudomonadota bacterium]